MKVKEITVVYGRRINLGDYSNAHLEVTLTADLDEDEDAATGLAQLWDEAKVSVKAQAVPLFKLRQNQIQEILAGLPADVIEALG